MTPREKSEWVGPCLIDVQRAFDNFKNFCLKQHQQLIIEKNLMMIELTV